MLEARDIFKSFKICAGSKTRIIQPLAGASMFVRDGEKVGIIGKSGEGKSTFANVVCGLLSPDGGNAYLNDHALYDRKGRYDLSLGRKVQLISQQPYLSFDPMQTVGAAIKEALMVNGCSGGGAEAKAAVGELFEKVFFAPELASRRPAQLSGGQLQRASIARALAMRPEVIVSDEATSMSDMYSQAQILKVFDRLAREDDISLIFISHDVALTRAFADRIYRLKNGVFELLSKDDL